MFGYEVITLMISGALWPLPNKILFIVVVILSMALSYWYYGWKQNGERIVQSYEKQGNLVKYARIGALLWYEGLLLPFIVAAFLILSQKLTGWPPHP